MIDFFLNLNFIHIFGAVAVIGALFLCIFFWFKPFETLLAMLFLRPLINLARDVKFSIGQLEFKLLWLYTIFITFVGFQYLLVNKRITLPRIILIPFILFFIICFISLFYTSNLFWGIGDFFRLFSAFIYFLLFYELLVEKKQAIVAIKVMASSYLLTLPFAIHNLIAKTGFIEDNGFIRIVSTFSTPNAFASYLVFVSLSALFIILNKEFKNKFFFIVIFTLSFTSLILTGTRTGWIAFSFAFCIFFYLKDKRYLIIPVVVVLLLGITPPIRERFLESFQKKEIGMTSWEWRLMVWKDLLKAFVTHPIQGFGLGSRFDVFQKIERCKMGPHNDYIRLLIELGLLGFFAFCAILLIFSKRIWGYIKHPDPFISDLNILSLSLLSGFCVISIATNQLTDVTMLMFVFSLIGLTLKMNQIASN